MISIAALCLAWVLAMNHRSIEVAYHNWTIRRAKQQIATLQAKYHGLPDSTSRKKNIKAQARNYRSMYECEERLITLANGTVSR